MQIEIGQILEGQVTRIAAFGAFVSLGDRQSGMVHISEMAERYIKDIADVVSVGDILRVKVIGMDDRGRISLSVKQARTPEEIAEERAAIEAERAAHLIRKQKERAQAQETASLGDQKPVEFTPYVRKPQAATGNDFEDMMSRFKSISDDKLSDWKRYTEGKRGAGKRKK